LVSNALLLLLSDVLFNLTLSHGPLTSCKSSGKMSIRGVFYWFLTHLQRAL